MRCAILLLAAFALTSCAKTMTAETCAETDWRAIGYQDGAEGEPADRYAERAAACADTAHPADRIAYDAGRREGLRRYCTYETGYSDGYGRSRYHGVCPTDYADGYERGYRRGVEDGRRRGPRWWPGIGVGVSGGSSSGVGVGIGTGIGIGF